MSHRIAVSPRIHFGKPCVAGTRITVQSVLELVRGGVSMDGVRGDYYPDLSIEDIRSCVQYAIEPDRFGEYPLGVPAARRHDMNGGAK